MKFFNPFPNNYYVLGRYNYHDKDDKSKILCNILIAVFFPKQHFDFFMQKMKDMERDMLAGSFTSINDDSMINFPFFFPDDFKISSLIWEDDKWRKIGFYAITPTYLIDEINTMFKNNFVGQEKEEEVKEVETEIVSEEVIFDASNASEVSEEELYNGSEEESLGITEEPIEIGIEILNEADIERASEEVPIALGQSEEISVVPEEPEEVPMILEEPEESLEQEITVLTIDSLINEMENSGKQFIFGKGFKLVRTPIKGEIAFTKIDKPEKTYSSESEDELNLFKEYAKKSGKIFLLLKHKNFIIIPESFGSNIMLFNHRIPVIDGLNVGMYVVKIPEQGE